VNVSIASSHAGLRKFIASFLTCACGCGPRRGDVARRYLQASGERTLEIQIRRVAGIM
jgi:hypothetical protein